MELEEDYRIGFLKKLIIGIICMAVGFFFCVKWPAWSDKIYQWENLYDWSGFFNFMGIIWVISFIYGFMQIVGGAAGLGLLGDSIGSNGVQVNGSLDGIKRFQEYRNSKLNSMSQEQAASEYMQTAWVEGLGSYRGVGVDRTIDYVNSKLNSMSYDAGYNWVKQNKK